MQTNAKGGRWAKAWAWIGPNSNWDDPLAWAVFCTYEYNQGFFQGGGIGRAFAPLGFGLPPLGYAENFIYILSVASYIMTKAGALNM